MKLIELLVKELPKRGGWPDDVNFIAQDSGKSPNPGEVFGYAIKPRNKNTYWTDNTRAHGFGDSVFKSEIIATDCETVFVTREEYEAALAESVKFKLDADGWVIWHGGGVAYNQKQPQDANSRANDDRLAADAKEWKETTDIMCERGKRANEKAARWDGNGLPPVGCECEILVPDQKKWIPVKVFCYHRGFCHVWSDLNDRALYSDNPSIFRPLRTPAERQRENAINEMASMIGRGTFYRDAEGIYSAIAAGKIPGVTLTKGGQ